MSDATFTLYYHPSIPGRGEYVRLLFEAAGTPYTESNDRDALQARIMITGTVGHPPHFAPPMLGVTPRDGQEWLLSQTPAILAFLGPRLGLVGDIEGDSAAEREKRHAQIQQLTLTALDLMLEAHDTHHPIANSLYCTCSSQCVLHQVTGYDQTKNRRRKPSAVQRTSARTACPSSSSTSTRFCHSTRPSLAFSSVRR